MTRPTGASGAREVRATFWAQQLRDLNRKRLVLIAAGFLLNVIFAVTGAGVTSRVILAGYATWWLLVLAHNRLVTRLTGARALKRLSALALGIDLAAIALLVYATGGGWWQGAMFFGVIVAIAALTLPTAEGRVILSLAVLAWTLLIGGIASGVLDPDPWFGLPRVTGNLPLLGTQYGLGLLAIGATWRLLRGHTRRTRLAYESNERMILASPYAIFTLDRQGLVRDVNPAALRVLGLIRDAVIGRGLLRFIPAADRPVVIEAFDQTALGESTHLEHPLQVADGTVRWVSVTYSPLVQPTGDDTIMVIGRDLTEDRRVALERERMQRELDESRRVRTVGRLVSGVAHELNNPLAAVLSFTEQLLADARDAEMREALKVVHDQATRARTVVRDLLQVVRDRGERQREATDVGALVSATVRAMAPFAAAHGVVMTTDLADGAPHALLDRTGIAQVLDNLLRNAVLAARAAVTVSVAYDDASGWRIAVTDDGAGITPEVLPQLFEPFFTTRAPGEGTGLGLAVSLGIAEQHDGTIRVDGGGDASGRGACFTIELPATLAAPRASAHDAAVRDAAVRDAAAAGDPAERGRAAPPPVAVPMTGRAPALLLVDDEPAIRQAIGRFLVRRGWTVESCASGTEARDRLLAPGAGDRFDAVLCDLRMPGMTGVELYRVLERERPALLERLVFATGDVASLDVAEFLADVRCPVLEKPFALADLVAALDRILAHGAGPA